MEMRKRLCAEHAMSIGAGCHLLPFGSYILLLMTCVVLNLLQGNQNRLGYQWYCLQHQSPVVLLYSE